MESMREVIDKKRKRQTGRKYLATYTDKGYR